MRKIIFAAVLTAAAVGTAQAQNLTIPAGDSGFGRSGAEAVAPAFVQPQPRAQSFQAVAPSRSARTVHHRVIR